ncbi:MAG: hypothetical protein A3G24_10395 [Betaproteobacteria bacterium RIFCSPLOWO2_12_FULL_62_13]|nr:MAG: hypothetical protein A3G24_10395 [Betaproteobacteria bacterium RIFCSPLOWO2_12_FULL_62_13]
MQPGALLAGPLYVEVKKRVMRSLTDGEWPQGAPIPSEAQLAQRYAVSVGTVRKAIGELVAERVLVRQPGRGTFVASHNRDYMLEAFFHIVDERGHKEFPASKLLTFRQAKADPLSAKYLRLAKDDRVFQFENLLHLQGKPVIFDRIRVPQAVFPDFDEDVFRQRDMTIFGLYQARHGVTVTRLEEWIRAANADDRLGRLLDIEPGAAVLRIERVAYTYDRTPVEFRERFVDTRSHAYLNLLGMKKT